MARRGLARRSISPSRRVSRIYPRGRLVSFGGGGGGGSAAAGPPVVVPDEVLTFDTDAARVAADNAITGGQLVSVSDDGANNALYWYFGPVGAQNTGSVQIA